MKRSITGDDAQGWLGAVSYQLDQGKMATGSLDHTLMGRALRLAESSVGLASPNPPVGCIIARDEQVVGEGCHAYAARDHAEVRALEQAGNHAAGATAYVTLEPCTHFGRTPPCVRALISAGVRRVVLAHVDPNPVVSGAGIHALRAAGLDVAVGVGQEEAARLIEPFARHVTSGLPLLVGKAGMSLDGRIAVSRNAGCRITSEEAWAWGQRLRLQSDAIVVGIGTILADDPQLTYRGDLPKARPLTAVVLDSSLRTPPGARLFDAEANREILIFSRADVPTSIRRPLEAKGAEIIPTAYGQNGLDLGSILRELGMRKKLGVLVEGGSEVHGSFFLEGLFDKFYFIVAPFVLGGRGSVPAVGGAGYASASAAPRFRMRNSFHVGPDLILEAYPSYSNSILSPWHR